MHAWLACFFFFVLLARGADFLQQGSDLLF
jgi:hypothetical protein